jgi:diacylglycerol kinase (ATP)
MRALLVVNRLSRRGLVAGNAVARALRDRGIEVVDGRSGNAEIDCIVAAGGDGTFVRLIPRAIALGVPMGLVPLGTFNDLARTLEIPIDVAHACDVIAGGHLRSIDVARVNGFYYVNEASIGISSRVARLQLPVDKQRFGFFAVIATAMQALLLSRRMHVEIEFDHTVEAFTTVQLTVANSYHFGGLFTVEDAAVDDGWLDLYSIEIQTAYEAYSVVRTMMSGKRQTVPGLRTYRAQTFRVRTGHAHRITADGEPAGKTPATFEIIPNALQVFVPASSA